MYLEEADGDSGVHKITFYFYLLFNDKYGISILMSLVFSALRMCCLVGKCKDGIASSVVIHL